MHLYDAFVRTADAMLQRLPAVLARMPALRRQTGDTFSGGHATDGLPSTLAAAVSAPLYNFSLEAMRAAIMRANQDLVYQQAPIVPAAGALILTGETLMYVQGVSDWSEVKSQMDPLSVDALAPYGTPSYLMRLLVATKPNLCHEQEPQTLCLFDCLRYPNGMMTAVRSAAVAMHPRGGLAVSEEDAVALPPARPPLYCFDAANRPLPIASRVSFRGEMTETFLKWAGLALGYLYYVDLPIHYIVAEGPAVPPRLNKLHSARFHERERWIVLEPDAVKLRMASRTDHQGGSHRSPVPHLRRGHTRTLTAERWTVKRGTVVQVRPTWIGDREWLNGPLRYRVISRAGATADQA